jgi:hypothetical protein
MVVGKSVYFLSFCQAKLQVMADILDVGDMEVCVPYKPQQSALALETVKQLFTGNRVEMTLMLEHWEGVHKGIKYSVHFDGGSQRSGHQRESRCCLVVVLLIYVLW